MINPAVSVTGLTKSFAVPFTRRVISAVRDLNFCVAPGEIYGLLGPNGSGKSTTLKIILGLVSATRGKAEIFGCDSGDVASREEVGFLPESPYFYKFLSAAETLRFYGKLGGLRSASLTRKIDDVLALVGLSDARDQRLGTFSKGMLQRIGLAQALVHDPRLLILDEPTAGVDPAGARAIRGLILKLKQEGKSVLLTSHLLEQVQEICDRVGILSRGVLVREGRIDDLVARRNQTELVLENAAPSVIDQLAAVAESAGARLISRRSPERTLEEVFLEATENDRPSES